MMEEILHQFIFGKDVIHYRVSYMSGSAGFLLSTVWMGKATIVQTFY